MNVWAQAYTEISKCGTVNVGMTSDQRIGVLMTAVRYISPKYLYELQHSTDNTDPTYLDCSKYVRTVFQANELNLTGNSEKMNENVTDYYTNVVDQYGDGKRNADAASRILEDEGLVPGDLLFWYDTKPKEPRIHHVAIYLCTYDGQVYLLESTEKNYGPNLTKLWSTNEYYLEGYAKVEFDDDGNIKK